MKKTNKGTKKRMVALALALTLAFSNTTVCAADVTSFRDVLEENMPETTEDTAFEEITETAETVVELATDTEASTEAEMSEANTTEASVTENASIGPTQVLVVTSDSGIFREGDVILSEYNGVYLLNYETADQATEAVSYYGTVADFAELNEVVRVAEGEGSGDEVVDQLEADEDALSVLNEIVDEGKVYSGRSIALIDTGVASGGVSVLGDEGVDDNGHGSLMLKTIMDENPEATVLSIKAFNESGYAQVSDVYAAIQYAIEKNVGIINLSASKAANADSEVIRTAVEEAVEKGIVFVGSAGNNNSNVKYFVPGNINSATIIGSAKEDGTKTDTSNYGDTVDYYVVADSTSVATAKFSGLLSANPLEVVELKSCVFKELVEKKDNPKENETDHNFGAYSSWPVVGLPDYFSVDLSDGGNATIYSGGSIAYGSWGTTPFSTETSSPTATNFNGTCIQPSLSTPSGTYTATEVTNQKVVDAMYIMYAMYRVPSDPWPAAQGEEMITVYDQWMGSTSYSDEQKLYVMWHLVMSYAVAKNLSDYAGTDWYRSCPSGVQDCVAAVYNNIFNIYYQFGNHAPSRFKVYILKTGSGKQDIVLWEMKPEARVRIAKSARFEGKVLTPAQYETCVANFKSSSESAYNLMRNTEYGVSYSNTDFSKSSSNYAGTLTIEGDADSAGDADNVSNSVNVTPEKEFYIKELKASDSGLFDVNTTVSLAGAGFSACCIYTESGIPTIAEVADGYEAKEGEIIVTDDAGKKYLWDDSKCIALNADGTKELITDEDGNATSVKLNYGRYIVRETTIPDNFHPVAPFTVTINENSNQPKELGFFVDESFKAYIRIIKKDSESKESILNNVATFKIWSYDDEAYVTMKTKNEKGKEITIDSFKTNEFGELQTPEPLFPGKYRIDETVNPVGYFTADPKKSYDVNITSTEAFEEYVTEDGIVTNMGVYTIEVDNTPIKGKILVEKKGGNRYYDETKKKFVITDEPLANIKFDIYADEDIKAAYDTSKVLYKKNALVTSVITDSEGKAESEEIPLGAYRLVEHVPADYEDVEPVKVIISLESKMKECKIAGTAIMEEDADKADEDPKGDTEDHIIIHKYVFEKVGVYNKPKEQRIHTTATEEKTKTKYVKPEDKVTIVDRVKYENLVTDGRAYTLKGTLMLKGTNTPLLVNGAPVTAEKTFKPMEKDGFEELDFTFDASALAGETIVVFENLYDGKKKVAVHTEIDSEEQTVRIPELGTTAREASSGKKKFKTSTNTTLVDTIHFKGVTPGDANA